MKKIRMAYAKYCPIGQHIAEGRETSRQMRRNARQARQKSHSLWAATSQGAPFLLIPQAIDAINSHFLTIQSGKLRLGTEIAVMHKTHRS
jgi:hypothetical protein